MATDKLKIYNMALGHLLERRLRSLSENREPRRVLDDYWDQEVAYCLERKMWNFIQRAVTIDASTSVTPAFGFLYAFPLPDDWIRTKKISSVPTLDPPLLQMKEESGFWYTNITPIYVSYNSNNPQYGMDLSLWPASFIDYVALRLARKACGRIPGKAELLAGADGLINQEKKACTVAAANCAMNDPVGFAPMSSWVRSRRGFSPLLPGPGGDSPTGGSLIP
jgi:hypothetical protein